MLIENRLILAKFMKERLTIRNKSNRNIGKITLGVFREIIKYN